MDAALPAAEQDALKAVLDRYVAEGVQYHALRTRQAGPRRFCSVHVLVPGEWTVQRGHALLERIEEDLRGAVPNMSAFTHLESLDDPASWDDMGIDRPAAAKPGNA
jgi:divalent metal cation (Fe/Co/Zn/Cd) transporter